MKALTKRIAKKENKLIFKSCVLLFLFMFSFTINVLATDEGPSIANAKKSSHVINTEQTAIDKARQEELAFQEKMSYVYMFLGLALVIGIAWFSTVYVRKTKKAPIPTTTNNHRHYIRHPHDPRRRPKVNRARR